MCGVCRRYSDIGGHTTSRIRKFGKLLRKTNEQEFSFRSIERDRRIADIQADTLYNGSLEMSNVQREVEGRKRDKELSVIGIDS